MEEILIHLRHNQYSRAYEPILPSTQLLVQGKYQYTSRHDQIPSVADALRGLSDIHDVVGDERMIYVMVTDVAAWEGVDRQVIAALTKTFQDPSAPVPQLIIKQPL